VLRSGDGHPFNGEKPEECLEFLQKLLEQLHAEEINARTENFEEPSLVEELFGLRSVQKMSEPALSPPSAY